MNELLFFKVWRNLIIRNNIFSILNDSITLVNGYKYKNIISVHWMIKNKHYQLLREKVTNGEYLIFNSTTYETYKSGSDKQHWIKRNKTNYKFDNGRLIGTNLYSLFNKQVAINWSNHFYQSLFKNYSNYFIGVNCNETEYILIEHDNFIGLLVLVEKFDHKLNIDSFYRAFEIGSYECAYYIFNRLKDEISVNGGKVDKKIWSIILNYTVNKNEEINATITNERIDFITRQCNLQIKESTIKSLLKDTSRSIYLYDFKIYQQSILAIINCMKSIIQLKELYKLQFDFKSFKLSKLFQQEQLSTSQTQSLKHQGQIQLNKEFQNIESSLVSLLSSTREIPTLEEIELVINSFTEKQLETIKLEPINLKQHQHFQIILKFYKIILPLTDYFNGCFIDNYIHYKISVDGDYSSLITYKTHKIITPREQFKSKMFGDYNFKELAEFSNSIYDYELFLHCRENREKQITFLNSLVQELKKGDNNLPLPVSQYSLKQSSFSIIENIITSLIWSDDIEFIEFIKLNLLDTNTDNQKSFSKIKKSLFSKVKSTTMFDVIYSINYDGDSDATPLNYSILLILINNDKYNLLDHYKSNYTLNYYSEVGQVDIRNSNFKFEILKFVYENLQDFHYGNVNIWDKNTVLSGYTLDQLIFIIKRTPNDQEYSCIGNTEFSDYVFLNRPFDILNLKCLSNPHDLSACNYFHIKSTQSSTSQRKSLLSNYFKSQELSHYPEATNNGLAKVISIEIGKYGNTEFLDHIMDEYISQFKVKSSSSTTSPSPYNETNQIRPIDILFTFILNTICFNGQLGVYKHLETNYPNELQSFLKLNCYLYNLPSTIIRMGHIDFLLYFLSSIKFVKKLKMTIDFQILSNDNNLLINYFKNTNNKYLSLKK